MTDREPIDSRNFVSREDDTFGDVLPSDADFTFSDSTDSLLFDHPAYTYSQDELAQAIEAPLFVEPTLPEIVSTAETVEELSTIDRIERLHDIKRGFGFYPKDNDEFNNIMAVLDVDNHELLTLQHLDEVYAHQVKAKKRAEAIVRRHLESSEAIAAAKLAVVSDSTSEEEKDRAALLLQGIHGQEQILISATEIVSSTDSTRKEKTKARKIVKKARDENTILEHALDVAQFNPVDTLHSIVRSYENYADTAAKDTYLVGELRKLLKPDSSNTNQHFKNIPAVKELFADVNTHRALMALTHHSEIGKYIAEEGVDVLSKKYLLRTDPAQDARMLAELGSYSRSALVRICTNVLGEESKSFEFWTARIQDATGHFHVRAQGHQALKSLGIE